MKKAITIQDIADQLNLSRNTVSKALNGSYVPEKTKKLVFEKARELNYKSMNQNTIEIEKNKKYRLLLLSGKPLNNMNFFIPIIRGIENYCYEHGYEMIQYIHNKDVSSFESFQLYIKGLNVDGIIAIETFEKDFILKLVNLGYPLSFLDFCAHNTTINGNYDIIETSNQEPIYQITKHLIKKYGLYRFTFVGDHTHCLSFQNRYLGMLQALLLNNIDHQKSEDILRSDNFDYGNPVALVSEIVKLKHKPHCYICCNDFIARSLCKALTQLNISVPKDAMVVGYDDVMDSIICHPTITTVGMNKEFIGAETVRSLIYRIENPNSPTRVISIDSNILIRESTKK